MQGDAAEDIEHWRSGLSHGSRRTLFSLLCVSGAAAATASTTSTAISIIACGSGTLWLRFLRILVDSELLFFKQLQISSHIQFFKHFVRIQAPAGFAVHNVLCLERALRVRLSG